MEIPNFKKIKDVPKNQEHLEAFQEDVNNKRKAYIDQLNEEDKENFLLIEKLVQKLDKSNIPFFLLAKPVKDNPVYWQYHKLTGKMERFTEEANKEWTKQMWGCAYAFNRLFCDANFNNNLGVTITNLKTNQHWITYTSQGVYPNPEIFGPKPPENGDEWKEKP